MALLRLSPNVSVGENTQASRRYFWLEDELGNRVDITGYAFRYRVYLQTINADGDNVNTELADVTGVISTAASGEFYFDFDTKDTALPPREYTSELVSWDSGTITDPPSDRYRGIYSVEGRLEAP